MFLLTLAGFWGDTFVLFLLAILMAGLTGA